MAHLEQEADWETDDETGLLERPDLRRRALLRSGACDGDCDASLSTSGRELTRKVGFTFS